MQNPDEQTCYAMVSFGYQNTLALPLDDAALLCKLFCKAIHLTSSYDPKIIPPNEILDPVIVMLPQHKLVALQLKG